MSFFLRYGALNMTFVHCKCVLHINYFRMFFVNYFYPNKSSDQLQAYSMLNKLVKDIDYDKFKFTTKN